MPAIQVLQKPSDIQPAQSPIVFSVTTSGSSQEYTSSEFQYTADLYVWGGTLSQSGSYIYQARKYPNTSGSGIFDFSKMINSTLTDLSATNGSNIKYYKVDFGWQYASGSTYVTQSGGLTAVSCSAGGTLFKAYDGYGIFPEAINTSLSTQDLWYPFMSDMGSVTQSVLITDTTYVGNDFKGAALWRGATDSTLIGFLSASATYENGITQTTNLSSIPSAGNTTSSLQVYHGVGAAPGDIAYWPFTALSASNLSKYSITAYSTLGVKMSTVNYEVVCEQYYEPVRIAYKNRYGQFDFLNFYKRHNNTFNTDQRLYEPQLGSWGGQILSYDQYQTKSQRYIVDATEVLEANTNWLSDGYNNLMKQLLVADEIYWLYDQSNFIVKPLTVKTNSLQFKTGVNNKLIQYTITFDIGQPYKLIL